MKINTLKQKKLKPYFFSIFKKNRYLYGYAGQFKFLFLKPINLKTIKISVHFSSLNSTNKNYENINTKKGI